jgi:hypothetical protein
MTRYLVALALCLLFVAPAAHARRSFVLFNTGSELFEVGALPREVLKAPGDETSAKAGYKCSHFGVFWADIATWDCKLVAIVADDTYADLPADVFAKLSGDPRYGFDMAQRSFWNHYAFWALIAALVAIRVLDRIRSPREASPRRPAQRAPR